MSERRERVYLYAIVDGDAVLSSPIPGFRNIAVELLPIETLAAVIGPVENDDIKDTAPAALLHEGVVEALMVERRVLPVRFGAVFSSRDALITAINTRCDILRSDLERIDGQVEIGVRVLWDGAARREQASAANGAGMSGDQQTDGPGIQYMKARMEELAAERRLRSAAESLGRQCRQALAPYASAVETKILVTDEIPVSMACLVRRDAIEPLVQAASRLQQADADIRVVCTGPWPPYHFVTGSEGE